MAFPSLVFVHAIPSGRVRRQSCDGDGGVHFQKISVAYQMLKYLFDPALQSATCRDVNSLKKLTENRKINSLTIVAACCWSEQIRGGEPVP